MPEYPKSPSSFFSLGIWQKKRKVQPATPVSERRRVRRTVFKKRASLVARLGVQHTRNPCLILDSSQDGFRFRGAVRLKRGQLVELILDEDPMDHVPCTVVWVAPSGSANAGEAGLQTVIR